MERYDDIYLSIFDKGAYLDLLQFADGKLHSDDGFVFNIHKVTLASKNHYFHSMFCGFHKDRTEFTVPGISGRCLAEILVYIYTEKVSINCENMADLLAAADYLLVKNLHLKIKERFKEYLTIFNVLRVYQVANQICDDVIARGSFRFVEMMYEEIMREQKSLILDLPFETLKIILSSKSLRVYSESSVWQTIVDWVEKDTSERFKFVPQILTCLPTRELDETLVLSILQNDLISQNSFMKELEQMIVSKDSLRSVDILSQFLESQPNPFKDSNGYRVSSLLQVIIARDNENDNRSYVFVTYDENLDLWRKLGEVDFQPDFLEVVGQHIYLFDTKNRDCMKFDLISKQRMPMQNFRYRYHFCNVTHIDEYIYILGEVFNDYNSPTYDVEVYDTVNDVWFDGISLRDTYCATSVALDKKMYAVGNTRDNRMMMQVFDSVTGQWSMLSPPTEFRNYFKLVAYRRKIYLIGGSTVTEKITVKMDVLDPKTNVWQNLPELPDTYTYTNATVINDRIIVYEDGKENICWNDAERKWKTPDPTCASLDFYHYIFATLAIEDIVRIITKENRNPSTKLEKSPFN